MVSRLSPLALIVPALVAVFFVGRASVKVPPPAAVEVKAKLAAREDVKVLEAVKVTQVLPAERVTRWRVEYRDKPGGGCEVAAREGSTTDTGPGSIVTDAKKDTVANTEIVTQIYVKETPVPLPRWTATALAGVDLSLSYQVAAVVSYRVLGPFSLSLAATVPLGDPSGAAVLGGGSASW